MEELLTQKEAAQMLRVTIRTLQAWRREGKLGFYRFGHRSIRIKKTDVLRMMREAKHARG